jgi:hypothetical protein
MQYTSPNHKIESAGGAVAPLRPYQNQQERRQDMRKILSFLLAAVMAFSLAA